VLNIVLNLVLNVVLNVVLNAVLNGETANLRAVLIVGRAIVSSRIQLCVSVTSVDSI